MRGTLRRRAAGTLLVVDVLLLAAACDSAPAEPTSVPTEQVEADCRSVVKSLLGTTQRYLDSVEGTTAPGADSAPAPGPVADPAQAEAEFSQALSDVRAYAGSIGCEPERFRDDLAAGLAGLRAGGPVANAVLLQLRADSNPAGRSDTVGPDDDLAAAVAAAPSGSVLQLQAGRHVLTETLALLRGVTLRGAGRDATTITGDLPGGLVLVLTPEPVAVEGLTLTLGAGAGSVISGAPAATLAMTSTRVSGARADADGAGGIGVLMAAGPAGQAGSTRRTSLRFLDSEAVDNAVAGIVVSGEHRAEVARAAVDRNGQCGICFVATSDGTVADSRFTANAAGLVAADDARPSVSGSTVTGGEVGVQALDRSAPQIEGTTVSGSTRAAFLFAGSASGSVRGTTCTGVPFGIVVGPAAAPEVDGNTGCELARGEQ